MADQRDALVVAESSVPKIFDRIDAATGNDAFPLVWLAGIRHAERPRCGRSDDLLLSRSSRRVSPGPRFPATGKTGYPDAYWVPLKAGMPEVGPMFDGQYWGHFPTLPSWITAGNTSSRMPIRTRSA